MLFKRNFLDRFGTAALIFSNEHLNDIMKIIKSLEESGLSIKDVAETIINEVKKMELMEQVKGLVKVRLEQVRILNVASSFK